MRKPGLLAFIMPLLPALAGAADPAPPIEAPSNPDASVVVPLSLVTTSRPGSYQMVQLKNGRGELATPGGGAMKVEVRNDKLWVDSDADGKITAKDASIRPNSSPDNPNNTISARMQVAGRETTVYFSVMQAQKEYAYIALAAALEGQFDGAQIRLIPASGNREGGDLQYQYIQVAKGGSFDSAQMQAFSKTADIGGKLYHLAPSDRGWSLKFTPYTGPVARVAIKIAPPANACDVTLVSADKSNTFSLSADNATACIPGDYRIQYVHLAHNENGKHLCIGGQQGKDEATLAIAAGDAELAVGGPFELAFQATFDGQTVTITEVAAIGASRVRYNPPSGNTDGQVFAAYLRSDGREQEIAKLSYG